MTTPGTRITKEAAGELIEDALVAAGTTWRSVAEQLGTAYLWTVSAVLGQHPMPAELATRLVDLVELPEGVDTDALVAALVRQPSRGDGVFGLPTDPTIYRFHEALMVYGPALKTFIHEEFGDGIMSAINFRLSAERVADPAGDRVVVTFDGKFLPYQW